MAAAAVENTGDFAHDSSLLFNKLNAVKASSETLEPIGALPVVAREQGQCFAAAYVQACQPVIGTVQPDQRRTAAHIQA